MKMLQSNHTIPSVHPTALSARTLRDENTRSRENEWPATSALNRISAVAMT